VDQKLLHLGSLSTSHGRQMSELWTARCCMLYLCMNGRIGRTGEGGTNGW